MNQSIAIARPVIEQIYAAALAAADPRLAVRCAIVLDNRTITIAGRSFGPETAVVIVAIGKAAVTMAQGALDVLGDRVIRGIAITKDGHSNGVVLPGIEMYEASHPIPDERGVRATQRAIEFVESCGPNEIVLALISGGGSALFESPELPVTLEDMATVTGLLLRAGAAIEELNAVRTPLSQVKGGGMLRRAARTELVTLIVSDVLGNDPRVIASGPTVPGNRDASRARQVLERFGLWDSVPDSVRDVLGRDLNVDIAVSDSNRLAVIADNRSAIEAAQKKAELLGLRSETIWIDRTGEAREQASFWVAECLETSAEIDCLIGGGELTVTVTGEGVGGRNTEFVLAAVQELHASSNHDWVIASIATDGQDGPTGVAGGFLTADSIDELIELGVDPSASIADNDTLAPLRTLGGVIEPGPTGTNVNDLFLAIRINALNR
ncbi:MAG: glycerate kinase type-2 family protein [Thermomicrobiales bacterium]